MTKMAMKRLMWEGPEIKRYLRSKKAWRLKIGPDEPTKPVPFQYIVYAPSIGAAVKVFRLKKITGVTDQGIARYTKADRH